MHASRAGWTAAEISRAVARTSAPLPRIDFSTDAERCPSCGGALRVQKTTSRTVATIEHGVFEAREIHKRCGRRQCPPTRPVVLDKLVRRGRRHGYDVIVRVGLLRYLAGRQRDEIRSVLLDEHGIELSAGTVSALCDRFLSLLERLHVHRAPQLRDVLRDGYPLHIDATCDRGKGGLFVCMDGWRGWVLWAGRVPTEHADHLRPLVDRTVQLFGRPNAVVRDMGEGGAGAVDALRRSGVSDLVCHYHFLAAVGTKLMEPLHDGIRGIIRVTKVRADMRRLLRDLRSYQPSSTVDGRFGAGCLRQDLKVLILWILEGDGSGRASFPFSLPHLDFARRCRRAAARVDQWVPCPRTQPERRAIAHLASLTARLERHPHSASTTLELETRLQAFAELRDVMRLSGAGLPRSDERHRQHELPALELLRLRQIKAAVDEYRAELVRRIPPEDQGKSRPSSAPAIISKYFRRYGARLFGHPARLDADGRVLAVVDRTNNVLEQFFGDGKRRLRRRVGRANLGLDLEQQPAQVALAANLRSPEYVRAVCGSPAHLPAAFAELDADRTVEALAPARAHRHKDLRARLRRLLAAQAPVRSTTPAEALPRRSAPTLQPAAVLDDWAELRRLAPNELRSLRDAVFPTVVEAPSKSRDARLPPPGTRLTRRFKGRGHRVIVTDDGFTYRGRDYTSISTVATEITGTGGSGYVFFRLNKPWDEGGAAALELHGKRERRRRRVAAATES